jgi:hypothetical protein
MSASEPTAMVPFFGNRPKALAAAVEVSSTKRLSEMRPLDDAAVVDEAHAVLDAGRAVGDLGEGVLAELLLVLEAERAVVGGDRLEVAEPGLARARPGSTSRAGPAS